MHNLNYIESSNFESVTVRIVSQCKQTPGFWGLVRDKTVGMERVNKKFNCHYNLLALAVALKMKVGQGHQNWYEYGM